jgi:predicted MPP superfamily phosphohydrolase
MTLLLALVGSLLHLYVALKIAGALAAIIGWQKKRLRQIALIFVLWFNAYPLVVAASYFFGLDNLVNALQRPGGFVKTILVYPFWLGLVFAAQLAMFFILLDIANIILSRFSGRYKSRWAKHRVRIVLALAGLVAVYAMARVYIDTWTIRTREKELQVANLPDELEGFRIVHIADLQAAVETNGVKLQNYVDAVNRLQPEVIFFSGDLVTSGTEFIDTGAQAMGRMVAGRGVYAVIGDHDLFSDKQLVKSRLQENGINVLDNLAAIIPVGSSAVSITGVTYAYRERPTSQTLATIEAQRPKGAVNIFLVHQPAPVMVDYARENGYQLFLAGHTHGGQLAFPLPGFLLTGSSFETPYVTGFYQVGIMLVSVNNGLGLTLAPIRYQAPAEVTLIRLTRAGDS